MQRDLYDDGSVPYEAPRPKPGKPRPAWLKPRAPQRPSMRQIADAEVRRAVVPVGNFDGLFTAEPVWVPDMPDPLWDAFLDRLLGGLEA